MHPTNGFSFSQQGKSMKMLINYYTMADFYKMNIFLLSD